MFCLTDDRTGFFYLGNNNEVYCCTSVETIPNDIAVKPYVKTEYLHEAQWDDFITAMYNKGITQINFDGNFVHIEADDIAYLDPVYASVHALSFITKKDKSSYAQLSHDCFYFPICIRDDNSLGNITLKKNGTPYIVCFVDLPAAQNFLEKGKFKTYLISLFDLNRTLNYAVFAYKHTIYIKGEC